MKKYFVLYIFFLMWGCDSFLDVNPNKSNLVPESVSDYFAILNNTAHGTVCDDGVVLAGDDVYVDDAFYNPLTAYEKAAYTWAKNLVESGVNPGTMWSTLYSSIYRFNLILSGVDDVDGTLDEKAYLKGEALLARATAYFYLVNIFGKAYDSQTASKDLGVPLVTEADITQVGLARATVARIYKMIEEDLLKALEMGLEDKAENTIRGSKGAVLGMLAKTYFYMERYPDALIYADKALDVNSDLLDMTSMTLNNNANNAGRSSLPLVYESDETLYAKMFVRFVTGLTMWGKVYASEELMDLYGEDGVDKRKELWFTKSVDVYGTTVVYDHYIYATYKATMSLGVSVPELMLIKAECIAREGNNYSMAIDVINDLRKKRMASYAPLSASSAENALELVLEERRRELAFTPMRWFDLKRLNKDVRFEKQLTRSVGGKDYTLAPNGNNYVFPLGGSVTDLNENLVDNQRD